MPQQQRMLPLQDCWKLSWWFHNPQQDLQGSSLQTSAGHITAATLYVQAGNWPGDTIPFVAF
jgi:hypothetical protein